MSRFTGKKHRGAARDARENRRAEALARRDQHDEQAQYGACRADCGCSGVTLLDIFPTS